MRYTNRLLGTLVLALMLAGLFATIGVADPGPNGNNEKGLCTAYFNGQKKGHDNENAGGNGNGNGRQPGEYPGPFQALVDEAGDDGVYAYCEEYGIEGNPGENGRFTECFDGDDESTHEEACPEGGE